MTRRKVYFQRFLVTMVLLCAYFIHSPSSNAQEGKNQARNFVGASSNNFPPMNVLDESGNLTGFGRELSDAVIEAINGKVTHIHSSRWVEVLELLDNGKADFIHDTGYTEDRDKFLDYSDPIIEMPEVIFVRKEQYDISNLDSLKGKNVACVEKHITHLYLQKFPTINCHIVNTPVQGLYELVSGTVDAFVYPKQIVLYQAQKLRLLDKIKIMGEPLRILTWSMVVKEGNKDVLELLNKGIAKVRKSGEYNRIYNKWWGKKILAGYSKQQLLLFTLASSLISILIVLSISLYLFNKKLRNANNLIELEVKQRRKSEEALRVSENKFRSLAENVPGLVLKYKLNPDETDELLYVSKSVEDIFEVPRKDAFNNNKLLWDRIHEDDLQEYVESIKKSAEDLSLWEQEHRLQFPGGREKWLYTRGVPLQQDDGSIIWDTIALDITEQKRVQNKLYEVNETFKQAQHFAKIGSWWYNPVTKMPTWTEEMFHIFGLELQPEALPYDEHRKIIHPDDWERFDSAVTRAVNDGIGYDLELRITTPSGELRHVNARCEAERDEQGKVKRLIGTMQDITERKKTEEALEESEQRVRLHLEQTMFGVIEWNLNFEVIEWNPAAENIFGYKKEEALGRHAASLIVPESAISHVDEVWNHLLKQTGGSYSTNENVTRDGRIIHCEWFNTRLVNGHGIVTGVTSLVRDITERKEAEALRADLESQLRQAYKMEAIGTLAGGIAHDFNNVLGIIVGNIELAKDDINEGNPALYSLSEARQACIRAKEMVRHILAFSRREEKEFRPVNIQPIVKEGIKMLRTSIPKTIELQQVIQLEKAMMLGDPTQIHQLMINLCTNASQAIDEIGTIEVCLNSVELDKDSLTGRTELKPGKYLRLTVSDNGKGIEPKILDKIFDPYFTTKKIGEGTGMGLAVVHGIVKEHGGDITVYSELGKGTTFHVLLPELRREGEQEAEDREVFPTGDESILFVDDEAPLASLGARMLERLGYKVESRTSSVEALEAFKINPDKFDLVVSDMTMPNMTGETLAKEIMHIRPDIPVILCTGFSHRMDEKTASEVGVKGFAMKPLVKSELAKMVRKVLDEK